MPDTIYIRNPKTTLAVDSSHFTLRSKGKRIGRIPPMMMKQVVIEHGVEITRKALDRLGTLGIPVTFLGKEGRVQARLVAPWRPNPASRLGQASAHFDPDLRLRLARRWVDAKLANCITLVRQYLSNHSDLDLSKLTKELDRHRDAIPGCKNIASLMGVEGIAARLWFAGINRMIRVTWLSFYKRTRRPPLDPGNSVLSYSYAVIANQLLACAEAVGLDPYVGYLHGVERNRPSLVLDMMEPFRPALGDRLMLRLVNLRVLKAEHFQEPDGEGRGVWISMDGRAVILSELAQWIPSCNEDLGEGFGSPGSIMVAEAERFALHSSTGKLCDFIPYYTDQNQIRTL